MLMRLIYASEATLALPPGDIDELLRRARTGNHKRDLTGALVFNHRYFLQALEGEREVVCDLYSRLARDARHHRLVILSADLIDQRAFADWSMAFAAADASHREMFLRNGVSSRFEPHALTGPAALQLLIEMAAAKVAPADAIAA